MPLRAPVPKQLGSRSGTGVSTPTTGSSLPVPAYPPDHCFGKQLGHCGPALRLLFTLRPPAWGVSHTDDWLFGLGLLILVFAFMAVLLYSATDLAITLPHSERGEERSHSMAVIA
jgi:hypothetical protein